MIDGHAHASGDLLTTEGILRVLDAQGVDRVVLVPGQHQSAKNLRLPNLAKRFPTREVLNLTNAMTRLAVRATGSAKHVEEDNEVVYGLTQECPGRLLQFYWVMLRHGFDVSTVSNRHRDWGFKGLKVHQCWDDFDVADAAFGALADYAAVSELPVFIHLNDAAQVTALIELAAERPDTTFIVGHLYGIERFLAADRPLPNVYFDFSCPDLVSDLRLRRALERFGAGRLILGSDAPFGQDNLARGIARIRSLDISEIDRELILGGNLERLLGVTPARDA
jgi:predicted TIM-barrel fold metal-dependent hydrolase